MKTIEEVIAGLSCNIPCNKNCPYYDSDPEVICRTDDMIEDAADDDDMVFNASDVDNGLQQINDDDLDY